jgi:hypothetical protein
MRMIYCQGENFVGNNKLVWKCCTPGVTAAMVSRQIFTDLAATRALPGSEGSSEARQ